jgi:hypothetical protein
VNTISLRKNIFLLLGLSAIAVLGSGLSADAQTVDDSDVQQLTESSEAKASLNQLSPDVENFYPPTFTPTPAQSTIVENNSAPVSAINQSQQLTSSHQETTKSVVTPIPGTTTTSSAALLVNSQTEQNTQAQAQPSNTDVAQADIDPGRPTRGGSSYIGIAGNIGLGGDSALGDANFMVISKIGLTNAISARPAAVLGDNTVILIPVSYDFSFRQLSDPFAEPLPIAPYVGAGAAIATGDGSEVSFLLTGGIDVPITPQFTATAAVNAAFFDETDIGLSIGVGYNFGGFGL